MKEEDWKMHLNRETRAFLKYALRIGALEIIPEGRKLKSGRLSPYFFNAGLFTTGEALYRLANAYQARYLDSFQDNQADVAFGPAYKGIPLVTAFALRLWQWKHISIEWAFNRKEEKDHGDGGTIVGASMEGKKILFIDDVTTSGLSSKESVEIIRAQGGTLTGGLIAFDRQEVGLESNLSAAQEFEQVFGVPMVAAATVEHLLIYMREIDHPAVPAIEAYRDQYGVSISEMTHTLSPITEGHSFDDPDDSRDDYPLPG